ncbi:TPA: arginase [Staphylococcus delphini]|uniref:arginase n=1 Tax=Staphylococcus delphini TaxID=53344 RepID=UPI000BBCB464|nr:arginase [Staphylococcus delphini]PCF45249.1 arginase [Staphylococcus delphini]PCF72257.1 arginase [Staphylococcus delphini]HEC2155514.1 arginase [Staphylococcus delphini]HEC2176358.1 arginase [Staphylococcus delphini]
MNKIIELIGAPTTFGQKKLGVDLGPDAIRYAGVLPRLKRIGHEVIDAGNVEAPTVDIEKFMSQQEGLQNYEEILTFSKSLKDKVSESIRQGHFPVILGGDHSLAIGSISGVAEHYDDLGIIWYDAHGDLNVPEESPSGNMHGMPLRILAGEGDEKLVQLGGFAPKVKPENIVLIGMRDLDFGEREYIKKHQIRTYTMADIDERGIRSVIEESIAYLKDKTDGVHLSLDVDALDPNETPGTGTKVLGGLTYRESHYALELLNQCDMITSMDIVEVNPLLDVENRTAQQAVALLGSFFGETLL